MRYFDSNGNERNNQASLLFAEATGFLRRKGKAIKEDIQLGIEEVKSVRVSTDVMKGPPLPDDRFIEECIEQAKHELQRLAGFTEELKVNALSPEQIGKFDSLVIAAAISKDPILMKTCNADLIDQLLTRSRLQLKLHDSVQILSNLKP